jgi:hypothetical protein
MCAARAATTAPIHSLAKHENFELRTLCNVIRINTDSDGKRATGVTHAVLPPAPHLAAALDRAGVRIPRRDRFVATVATHAHGDRR